MLIVVWDVFWQCFIVYVLAVLFMLLLFNLFFFVNMNVVGVISEIILLEIFGVFFFEDYVSFGIFFLLFV